VTTSLPESSHRRSLSRGLLAPLLLVLLGSACRTGLPPEPPGHDASEPGAKASRWAPAPNPYARSAFEGVRLDDASGHAHHHAHAPAKEMRR
jgi:hypothetical protein